MVTTIDFLIEMIKTYDENKKNPKASLWNAFKEKLIWFICKILDYPVIIRWIYII